MMKLHQCQYLGCDTVTTVLQDVNIKRNCVMGIYIISLYYFLTVARESTIMKLQNKKFKLKKKSNLATYSGQLGFMKVTDTSAQWGDKRNEQQSEIRGPLWAQSFQLPDAEQKTVVVV